MRGRLGQCRANDCSLVDMPVGGLSGVARPSPGCSSMPSPTTSQPEGAWKKFERCGWRARIPCLAPRQVGKRATSARCRAVTPPRRFARPRAWPCRRQKKSPSVRAMGSSSLPWRKRPGQSGKHLYCTAISTRRFCGSRTPSPVCTSRPCSPRPITLIACVQLALVLHVACYVRSRVIWARSAT